MALDICNHGWYSANDVQQEEGHFLETFRHDFQSHKLVVNVFAPLLNLNILSFYGVGIKP